MRRKGRAIGWREEEEEIWTEGEGYKLHGEWKKKRKKDKLREGWGKEGGRKGRDGHVRYERMRMKEEEKETELKWK